MFNILAERTIRKPIEEVFALLSDHENYSQFKGIDASRLIYEGTKDKNGVGAVREVTVGKGILHEEIVRFENPSPTAQGHKNAVLGYKITFSKPLTYDHHLGEIHMNEHNGTTHVRWISNGRITTFLLGPLIFDKQIQKQGGRAFGSILKYIDNL